MKSSITNFFILPLLAAIASPVLSRIADPRKGKPRALALDFTEKTAKNDVSEQFPYIQAGKSFGLKCPEGTSNGRMFKNTNTANEMDCYERCYGLESCNFFSYWASENMCIGCTLDDHTQLVYDSRFTSYKMATMKSAGDFGYELWNGVEGLGKKCPFKHEDRISKFLGTTKDECFKKCKEHEECKWFSWGEDEVKPANRGDCMLCREDDELDEHQGFNFWRLLEDDALSKPHSPTVSPLLVPKTHSPTPLPLKDDTSPKTHHYPPSKTHSPTASPTKKTCPGEIELLKHDGVTVCEAVSIVSQDTTTVTVKLTQNCTPPKSDSYIDFAFWQYRKSEYSETCLGADEIHSGESTTFTISCTHMNQKALLKLWVVDDISKGLMSEGDDAVVPKCCHPDDVPEGTAASRAVYAISCVPTC